MQKIHDLPVCKGKTDLWFMSVLQMITLCSYYLTTFSIIHHPRRIQSVQKEGWPKTYLGTFFLLHLCEWILSTDAQIPAAHRFRFVLIFETKSDRVPQSNCISHFTVPFRRYVVLPHRQNQPLLWSRGSFVSSRKELDNIRGATQDPVYTTFHLWFFDGCRTNISAEKILKGPF